MSDPKEKPSGQERVSKASKPPRAPEPPPAPRRVRTSDADEQAASVQRPPADS